MNIRRQELNCHNCGNFVQFDLDLDLDGQHILICPVCKHKHFRIIKNGIITSERWGQDSSQNIPTYIVSSTSITSTIYASYDKYTGTNNTYLMSDAWLNTTTLI